MIERRKNERPHEDGDKQTVIERDKQNRERERERERGEQCEKHTNSKIQ